MMIDLLIKRIIPIACVGIIGWQLYGKFDGFDNDRTITQSVDTFTLSVEPIALECRALVHAKVPVEITQHHEVLGIGYRTDTASMVAIGDVEVCVKSDDVIIKQTTDGRTFIEIPATSIILNRPRVDAVATADSIEADKGFVGELTDLAPGVDDDDGTLPSLYSLAQETIANSGCMKLAYQEGEDLILAAYVERYGDVAVRIMGDATPDLPHSDTLADCELV